MLKVLCKAADYTKREESTIYKSEHHNMLNKMSAVRIFFTLSAGNIDFKIKFIATHLSVHNILSDKETFLYFDRLYTTRYGK